MAILSDLIGPNQTSFIPARNITENVVMAQEIIHPMRRKSGKFGFMAIKVDVEKDYDQLWALDELLGMGKMSASGMIIGCLMFLILDPMQGSRFRGDGEHVCQTPAIMDVENQSFLGFSRNGNFTTKSTIVLSVTRSAVGIKRIGNSFGVGKTNLQALCNCILAKRVWVSVKNQILEWLLNNLSKGESVKTGESWSLRNCKVSVGTAWTALIWPYFRLNTNGSRGINETASAGLNFAWNYGIRFLEAEVDSLCILLMMESKDHNPNEPPAGLGFWFSYDLYGDEDFPFYDVLA
ncbi:hypothetical protein WN944_006313 [Citrus x changshan-huyou]|uniref:RNase H type-1 domain-containing protein n=1 Tax=Citrus x changshan-huyou TaxID=2935761 RepID=A0AAP0MIZ5_9ROSI